MTEDSLPIQQKENVDKAFSAQASHFDEYEKQNRILQWMRSCKWQHMEQFIREGDSILDINAGTGIDAIHFAQKGHNVDAIDIAEGMVAVLKRKGERMQLSHLVSSHQCSFTNLVSLSPKKFNHVISNFGGLNCTDDLRKVAEQIKLVLVPKGKVTLVIMSHVCLWEMLHALKGNFTLAFRRFHHNGITAHVEGHYFKTYYYSVSDVVKSFGDEFSVLKVRGLASLSPPPYMEKFPVRYPRIYSILIKIDELVSTMPPFNRWADHFILTLQYLPRNTFLK